VARWHESRAKHKAMEGHSDWPPSSGLRRTAWRLPARSPASTHRADRRRSASDGERRLVAAPREAGGDGGQWTAAFRWSEPPVSFDAAELELGDSLTVTLPAPGTAEEALDVRRGTRPPADALRLQADLLTAREDAREANAAKERLVQELARAREDLELERIARAADAERFKHGLAEVRDAGERAVAAADAELTALRQRVTQLDEELGEVATLRAAVADAARELEQAQEEHDETRAAMERAWSEVEETEKELKRARAEAAERDQLRARLDAVRLALGD
jgi:hypothetical protein